MKPIIIIKNPACHNDNSGSITIRDLQLSHNEKIKYGRNYSIEWSNNILAANLTYSNKIAAQLTAGTYSFRIFGNGHTSEWITLELHDPPSVQISDLQVIDNKVSCVITGGQPPYIVYVNKYYASTDNYAEITVNRSVCDYLRVIDSNNCSVLSEQKIELFLCDISYSFETIAPPSMHDNHTDSFILSVTDKHSSDHNFIVYDEDNNIVNTIKLSGTKSILQNTLKYDLSKFMYPGSYVIEIVNHLNHRIKTIPINIPNTEPLSVQISCVNDFHMDNFTYNNTIFIYDTLLIPYALLLEDSNILNWVVNLNNNKGLNITVDNNKISFSLLKLCPNHYCIDNNIDMICLDANPAFWYIRLNFAKGFDIANYSNLFVSKLSTTINGHNYPISLDMTAQDNKLKLIRSNLITNHISNVEIKSSKYIGIYEQENQAYNLLHQSDIEYHSYNNLYVVGNCISIDFISSSLVNQKINLDNLQDCIHTIHFTPQTLSNIQDINNVLQILNDPTKNIFVAKNATSERRGSITFSPSHRLSEKIKNITYIKYHNNKTYDILYNNNIASSRTISKLDSGIYIVKISTKHQEILKTINSEPYDQHYISAIKYISDFLHTTPQAIGYDYGDILVIIYNDNTNLENIVGLTYNIRYQSLKTKKDHNSKISQLSKDQYQLQVVSNKNVKININGPNNFIQSGYGTIKLNNLPTGVYTISGDESSLKEQYLHNDTTTIFINDKPQIVNLNFLSYLNQFVISQNEDLL